MSARRDHLDEDPPSTPPREAPAPPERLEADRAWLDAYRRGEKDALRRVFAAYVDDVALTLRAGVLVDVDGVRTRVGRDLDEWALESLLQEVFVRAFSETARSSYDGVRPFGAYLGTVARNLMVDRARRRRREAARIVPVADVDAMGARTEAVAEDVATERQIHEVLRAFVSDLDEVDRRVFGARYTEELSLRAASRALDMPLFELRKRDARLRRDLLAKLRSHGLCRSSPVRVATSVLDRGAKEET
jgi:RNA polymerase sigma-70 factor (ECF subfamily)